MTGYTDTVKIYADGRREEKKMQCMSEHILRIYVNGKSAYRIICTADKLRELALGRLYTDGYIKGIAEISVAEGEKESSAYIGTDTSADTSEIFIDTVNARPADRPLRCMQKKIPDAQKVFSLAGIFADDSGLHGRTGGAHRSIIMHDGRYIISEDISRHNTIDKAIGAALEEGFDLSGCMIFTSGRVPVDMTEKVIAAGIPVLISKSVPTADAVRLAERYGLTLICRAWPDSYEICTV